MAKKFFPITVGANTKLTVCIDAAGRTMDVVLPYATDSELEIRTLRRDFPDRIREVPILRWRNLVRNPSAEIGTTGWQTSFSGTSGWALTRQTTHARNGEASFRLAAGTTGSAASRASIITTTEYRHPAVGGEFHLGYFWAYHEGAATRQFKAEMIWYREDGSQGSIYGANATPVPPGEWTKAKFVAGTAPADSVAASMRCSVMEPVAGEQYFMDSIFFYTGAWADLSDPPDYFDGDTTADFHEWEGTPHDSISREWW